MNEISIEPIAPVTSSFRDTTVVWKSCCLTDFFKFSLYWDTSKFYYKAVNTTTNVVVSGTFTALVADIPQTTISLYPQCCRVQGDPNTTGQAQLRVQRFGVYY